MNIFRVFKLEEMGSDLRQLQVVEGVLDGPLLSLLVVFGSACEAKIAPGNFSHNFAVFG